MAAVHKSNRISEWYFCDIQIFIVDITVLEMTVQKAILSASKWLPDNFSSNFPVTLQQIEVNFNTQETILEVYLFEFIAACYVQLFNPRTVKVFLLT